MHQFELFWLEDVNRGLKMLFPWKCAGFGHGRAVFGGGALTKIYGNENIMVSYSFGSARNDEKKGVKVKTQKDKIM